MNPLIIFYALLLTSCAVTNDTEELKPEATDDRIEQVADSPKTKKICKRETPTGSHRTIVTCRTVEQVEKDKENARALRNRPGSTRPAPGPRQ